MKPTEIERTFSNHVYILKTLAIVCVAAAHCASFSYPEAESIRALLGTLGVPVFLICSGYFFKPEQSRRVFWKKKVKSIILPWLVWGVITFAIIRILQRNLSIDILAMIRWIVGWKTWLYFVPVLLGCFVIFRLTTARWWIYINIAVFFLSWTLTHTGVFQVTEYLTLYQNPFNFTGFFALGILLKDVDLDRIYRIKPGYRAATVALTILVGILYTRSGSIGYWGGLLSIPFELLGVMSLFWCAAAINDAMWMILIGKQTYFIYFVHMQLGSALAGYAIWNWIPGNLGWMECIFAFVRPITVVLATYLLYLIVDKCIKAARLEHYNYLIGI